MWLSRPIHWLINLPQHRITVEWAANLNIEMLFFSPMEFFTVLVKDRWLVLISHFVMMFFYSFFDTSMCFSDVFTLFSRTWRTLDFIYTTSLCLQLIVCCCFELQRRHSPSWQNEDLNGLDFTSCFFMDSHAFSITLTCKCVALRICLHWLASVLFGVVSTKKTVSKPPPSNQVFFFFLFSLSLSSLFHSFDLYRAELFPFYYFLPAFQNVSWL